MSDHFVSVKDLPTGGERFEVGKISRILFPLLAVGGVGLVLSAIIFLLPGEKGADMRASYAYSWLFAFQFFFTLVLGGLFWILLHNAINAGWGIAVRRLFEHLANMVPWLLLLALPLLLPSVREALWEWMGIHRESAKAVTGEAGFANLSETLRSQHHALLYEKYNYLNLTFWVLRFFLFFGILWFGAHYLRKRSLAQEKDGKFEHTFAARRFACGWLPLFAIAVTFSAVDWLMALDYTWFSTMWGVYLFAGSAQASMAVGILVLTLVRSQGYMKKVTTMEHYHLMGKLLFAFTVFWAYIAFSQFFLIWYANITEETKFYILRNSDGWNWVAIGFLLVGHFGVPFLLLLHVWLKKTPWLISMVCGWILLMHAVDIYWIIIPERGPSLTHGAEMGTKLGWLGDIVAFLTFAGILSYLFLRSLGKYSLYPWRDPRLQESINVSN